MAKYFLFSAFLLSFSKIYSQTQPWNHFEAHGLSASPDVMINVESVTRQACPQTFNNRQGVRPEWYSTTNLDYQAFNGVYNQLDLNNKTNYIGIGHSAGGLIARSVSHIQGVVPRPLPDNVLVRGFITMGTPNTGAIFAGEYSAFAYAWTAARAKIWRAPLSFFGAIGGHLFGSIMNPAIGFVGSFERAYSGITNGAIENLRPGSSYLTTINGATRQSYEQSLPNGKACVYSEWGHWKYPAFFGGGNPAQARTDYLNEIRYFTDKNGHHDRTGGEHQSKGRWWRPWWYASAAWHRMRAGDYNAARAGMNDVAGAWEQHTSHKTNSDAFIATSSQIGLPNVGPNVRKMDGEITHNTQLNVQYYNPQGEALRFALNQFLRLE